MIVQTGFKEFLRCTILDAANTTKVFLVRADFDGTNGALTWAGITEANYPGYGRQIYNDGSGVADLDSHPWGRFISPTFTFQPSGIVTAQTIYGIGTLKVVSGSPVLLSIEKFDAPVVLSADTHKVERGIDFYSRNFTP